MSRAFPDDAAAMAALDSALGHLAKAEPRSGLEARVEAGVLARMTTAEAGRNRTRPGLTSWLGHHRLQLASALLVLLIAAGVLYRSLVHRPASAPVSFTPAVLGQGGGLQTAGARQVTGAAAHTLARGRSQHRTGAGRATVARDAHRPAGVVAPAEPRPVR